MNKIKKILHKPHLVVPATFVFVFILAMSSYIYNRKNFENEFSNLNLVSSSTLTNFSSGQDLTLAFPVGGRIKTVNVKAGDQVKKGQVLAQIDAENVLGSINQARAAYDSAKASYEKLINGASTPDVQVAKVALSNAKINLDTVTSQQKVLVSNAFTSMMNSGLTAVPQISGSTNVTPVITGTYNGTSEGVYTITTYATGNGVYYSVSGLEDGGSYPVTTTPSPLGKSGLYIQFQSSPAINISWDVSVPNKQSSAYLVNSNAYKSTLETQSQAINNAKALVDSAQATLDQKLAGARREDIDIAKAQVQSTEGALQIAQGAYNNTVIIAPVDGKIINVTITAGQVAVPNAPAIELIAQ